MTTSGYDCVRPRGMDEAGSPPGIAQSEAKADDPERTFRSDGVAGKARREWQEMCPADIFRDAEDQEGVRAGKDEAMSGPEDEEEPDEARQAKPAHDPRAPTKAEYDRHMLTHLPYRAWCPRCVTGCGRSSQHRRAKEHEAGGGVPAVPMDYRYMTETSTPVLCLKCSKAGVIATRAMTSNEATPELVRLVVKKPKQHGPHKGCAQGRRRTRYDGFGDTCEGNEDAPHHGRRVARVRATVRWTRRAMHADGQGSVSHSTQGVREQDRRDSAR